MIAQCHGGRSCVAYDTAIGLAATPTLDGGPLCQGCLNRARFDIAALPRDYDQLAAELTPGGRPVDAHVSGGDPDAPVPLAMAVDELRRGIVWTLTVWEPPVLEALGVPERTDRRVRDRWAVAVAARLLSAQVRRLAALGPVWGYADGLDAGPVERDGPYAVESLRALHLAAQRCLGSEPRTRREPGFCRSLACGAAALTRPDGGDTVTCTACGSRLSYDEYRRDVQLTP